MTMTNDQIAEAVDAALKYAIELAEEEDGWKVEKEQGEATVKTKKNKDGRKVWLCTATVNVNPTTAQARENDSIFVVEAAFAVHRRTRQYG